MKVVFWAVPVLAAVASHFVGCAEAAELGDKVLPFVEEVRMLADIRNKRERDKLQMELNETRYRETTRAISFLTASFDKQVEELIATKEPSTRDLFLQVLEAQGDTERVDSLKREMAKRKPEEEEEEEEEEARIRPKSRASQSKAKRSRSRSRSRDRLPLQAVIKFGKANFKYSEKVELFKFFEEIGRGSRLTDLLEALSEGDQRAIAMELKEFARRKGSSRSKKSPEEIDPLYRELSRKVKRSAYAFLTYDEQTALAKNFDTVPDTRPPPPPERQVDVPLRAVMEFGKLSFISDKAEVLKFLQEIGRGAMANELLVSLDISDRRAIETELEEIGEREERQRSRSRSKKSPEELKEMFDKFRSKEARKVAHEFLTRKEIDEMLQVMISSRLSRGGKL